MQSLKQCIPVRNVQWKIPLCSFCWKVPLEFSDHLPMKISPKLSLDAHQVVADPLACLLTESSTPGDTPVAVIIITTRAAGEVLTYGIPLLGEQTRAVHPTGRTPVTLGE
jgi:hypothetical protein